VRGEKGTSCLRAVHLCCGVTWNGGEGRPWENRRGKRESTNRGGEGRRKVDEEKRKKKDRLLQLENNTRPGGGEEIRRREGVKLKRSGIQGGQQAVPDYGRFCKRKGCWRYWEKMGSIENF